MWAKLANFEVLDKNLLKVQVLALAELKVMKTIYAAK